MPDTKPLIYIELLGGLRMRWEGIEAVEYPAHQPDAPLACLALDLSQSHRRETLMEQLWPGDDADTARHKLRHCLYVLRRRFAEPPWEQPDLLLVTRTTIRLDPDRVHTDVARFEELLQEVLQVTDIDERAKLLGRAIDLYRGDLLAGFYQDCFLAARNRLSGLYASSLHTLTQLSLRSGALENALACARHAAAHQPLVEENHCTLMLIYAEMGQPVAVLNQFKELERILMEQLGEEPSPTTRLLMETLRHQAQEKTVAPSNGANGNTPPATEPTTAPLLTAAPAPGPHLRLPAAPTPAPRRWPILLAGAALLCLTFLAGLFARSPHVRPAPGEANHNPSRVPDATALWTARYAPAPDETDGGEPHAMALDAAGNIYITGFVHTMHNDADFLTLKYDPNGHLLWRARYNGPGNDVDRAYCIAVGPDGSVYVVGDSDNGKGNGLTRLAGLDLAVIKYDPDGKPSRSWPDVGFGVGVRRYNGPGDGQENVTKLCVGRYGNVYVTGVSDAVDRSGSKPRSYHQWVTIQYRPDGSLGWVRTESAQGGANAEPADMVVDKDDNVYVTGYAQTSRNFILNADWLTIKYSRYGEPIWLKPYADPHNGDDFAHKIALDENGNVYVTGDTNTGDPINGGGRWDILTIKYDANGNEVWPKPLLFDYNRRHDEVYGLAVDREGRVAVVGFTDTGVNTNDDYLTVLYNADGTLRWKYAYTGPGRYQNVAHDVAFDSHNNIIVTGWDYGGSARTQAGTDWDYFTIKYDLDGHPIWKAHYDYCGMKDQAYLLAVDRNDNAIITGMSGDNHVVHNIATLKYAP